MQDQVSEFLPGPGEFTQRLKLVGRDQALVFQGNKQILKSETSMGAQTKIAGNS